MLSFTHLQRALRQPTDRPRYTGPSRLLREMDAADRERRRKVRFTFLAGVFAGVWIGGVAVTLAHIL